MAKAKPDTGKGIAVVVAGMHRSGTSSLTKVLSAFGYTLPKTLLAASSSNETGFWESSVINRLNDKIFESTGSNWRSWHALPTNWGDRPSLAALRNEALATLNSEFNMASTILLKDPRLSRLMPFWYPVLEKANLKPVVICPIRNPIETAASLEQRNGLPQAIGLLIWLRYQLDLEFDTRGNKRSFTHYNTLLNDWLSVINKIKLETGIPERELDADTTKELGSWLSPKFRHHQFTDAAALHDTAFPEWVRAAYTIFLKWSQVQEEKADFTELDRIRSEFDSVPDSLRGILEIGQKNIDDARRLRKKIDNQEAELAETKRQSALRDAAARVYEEQYTRAQSNIESSMQRWAQLDSAVLLANDRLQDSKNELAEARKRQFEISEKLKESELKLAAYERGLKDAEDRSGMYEQRIEDFLHQLAQKEAELTLLSKQSKEHDEANLQLAQREAEVKVLASQSAERQHALDSLDNAVKELQHQLRTRELALSNLDQKFSETELQHEEARLQLAQKEAEAKIFAAQSAERQNALDSLSLVVKELQQQLFAREFTISSLDQKFAQSELQRDEARLQLVEKETESRIYSEQLLKQQNELKTLETFVSELRHKLSGREEEINNINNHIVQVDQQHELTRHQLVQKETESRIFFEQNIELRRSLDELNNSVNNLQQKLSEQVEELSFLSANNSEIAQERDSAQYQLAQKDAEAKLYAVRYVERQKMLEEQIRIVNLLQQELAGKVELLSARDQKLVQIEALLVDVQRQLEQKQVEASVLSQQNLELQTTLQVQIEMENQLKQELLEIEATLAARSDDLARMELKYQDIFEQLEEKSLEVNSYSERNLELQLEIDEQISFGKEKDLLLQEYETEISEHKQANKAVSQRYKEILDQLVLSEAEVKSHTEIIQSLNYTLASVTNKFNDQKLILDSKESTLQELHRNLAELDFQNDNLLQQLSEKSAQIENLSNLADVESKNRLEREKHLSDLRSKVHGLQLMLLERDHEIEKISGERVIALKQHEVTLKEIQTQLALTKGETSNLKSKLLDTRKKRDTTIYEREIAKRKITRLEGELNRIYSSPMWKILKSISATWDRLNSFLPTKSGRRQRQDLETIKSSALFDGNWYLERYPDIAKVNMDPALHYLRYGAREGRNPGPSFNTRFYVDRYTDVARQTVNPLVHYERFGRNENRRTEVADRNVLPAVAKPSMPAAPPLLTVKLTTPSRQEAEPDSFSTSSHVIQPDTGFSWLTQTDLLRLSGQSMLTLGGMDIARAGDDGDIAQHLPSVALATIQTFVRLGGLPEIHGLRLRHANAQDTRPINSGNELALCSVHAFADFPISVEAIWFTNNRDIRIRINAESLTVDQRTVIRGYQYASRPDGGLVMVGEHAFSQNPFHLMDFALFNPYLPILLVLTTPEASLVSATLLPFPSMCPGGSHELERFASQRSAETSDIAKLARSLLTEHQSAADSPHGWALSRIRVDIRGATGTERIFSSDIKEWLWNIFAVKPEIWSMPDIDPAASSYWREIFAISESEEMMDSNRIELQAKRSRMGGEMTCPSTAIPTIHLLTTGLTPEGGQKCCTNGRYIISQTGDSQIRWLVDMPITACTPDRSIALTGCVRHPYISTLGDSLDIKTRRIGAPIALVERDLHPRHASQLIMPVAPDIDSPLSFGNHRDKVRKISVVITADNLNADIFEAMLESLQLQHGIDLTEVLVALSPTACDSGFRSLSPALQRFFPNQHRLLECNPEEGYTERVQRAVSLSSRDDDCLLFINLPIILNDIRLLDTLSRLLLIDQVATSSCLLYSSSPAKSASPIQAKFSGILPIRKPGLEQSECLEFDAQALFPLDAYPVASTGDALFMIETGLWHSVDGFATVQSNDPYAAVMELSMKLAERGMSQLMTTLVSAEAVGSTTANSPSTLVPELHALHDVSTCIEVLPS